MKKGTEFGKGFSGKCLSKSRLSSRFLEAEKISFNEINKHFNKTHKEGRMSSEVI